MAQHASIRYGQLQMCLRWFHRFPCRQNVVPTIRLCPVYCKSIHRKVKTWLRHQFLRDQRSHRGEFALDVDSKRKEDRSVVLVSTARSRQAIYVRIRQNLCWIRVQSVAKKPAILLMSRPCRYSAQKCETRCAKIIPTTIRPPRMVIMTAAVEMPSALAAWGAIPPSSGSTTMARSA
ncbi:hypothetical protein CA54_15310 [Symmachiella macrocystis]|uniref:Uncharacterized protein n=1 Tax=Symmachiella macrocystis TaxID=2527985 RepID=A0A5C6BN26_9PLAN|nr:hypothetical protein CA54_15310 [Symmachiella macrocystis]